jgi:hypothetical protein
MKTKNTKKPMKVISLWKITLVVAVLLTALFPMFGQAGQIDQTCLLVGENCTTRPLSDFLNAQGSSSSFFPPVKDYVGWTDGNFTTFALVDYVDSQTSISRSRLDIHSAQQCGATSRSVRSVTAGLGLRLSSSPRRR